MSLNYKEYNKIINNCLKISKRKNADYGCNSLTQFGAFGVLVRMNDKIQRLNTIYKSNKINCKDEKIEDTINDLINYSIYILMIYKGKL